MLNFAPVNFNFFKVEGVDSCYIEDSTFQGANAPDRGSVSRGMCSTRRTPRIQTVVALLKLLRLAEPRSDGEVRFAGASFLGRVVMSAAIVAGILMPAGCATPPSRVDMRERCRFIAFKDFSTFAKTPGTVPGEIVLTSPGITVPIAWDELVASWNVLPGIYLKLEVRGLYPDHATRFYTLAF